MIPLRHPLRLAALCALVLALVTAGSASAQITVGEVVTPTTGSSYCHEPGPFDLIPGGATASLYTVPNAGVITSWSNYAGAGVEQKLSFKVFRPVGDGPAYPKFLIVGENGPRLLQPETLNTFPVEIPVAAGDLIGDNDENAETVNNTCLARTTNPADITYYRKGSLLSGVTFEAESYEAETQMNVKATLLAAPTVSAVTPGKGTAVGGTAITITGSEFARVQGVTVGGVPVPFTVASEASISATTTAGTAGAATPVTVTTIAGTGSGTFTYEVACKVPKLKGKSLRAAKKALAKAHCKLGKVSTEKGVTAKSGKVVKVSPSQGSSRPAGTKVSVKLG
ncbi:MAG: IPT/TIG domain-containing protein [Solirubrobacterales bacterium]